MGKLSKREIRESLDSIPMDTLLLGTGGKGQLTHKQKTFAKGVAKGLTKSEAYRQAYDTTQNPSAVHSDAQKLMRNPRISHLIEAYRQANEAREYQSPTRLRELVIHQLTMHALSEDVPPAQRIKSLELLGKVTEVGAFTERKESVVIHESSKLKQKLLDQLKTIVTEDGKPATEDEGDQLLRELMGYRSENQDEPLPTGGGEAQGENDTLGEHLHNIPLTQPNAESDAICTQNEIVNENNELLTGKFTSDKKEGVGVVKNGAEDMDVEYREGPLSEKGTPESGEG